MARIRTIKPEFWSDGAIIECSTNARLLFVGMWNFADDFGNLDRSAKQIKAQVFPSDSFECEPLIQELLNQRLIVEYSSNGKLYLHIQSFAKHQKVDRPGAPRCPPFSDSVIDHRTFVEPSTSIRDGREGKGRELTTLPGKPGDGSNSNLFPDGFSRFWQQWPTGERKQSKGKCSEVWKRKGCERIADRILAHVESLKASDSWNNGFVPAPLVYLNQARWEGAEVDPAERVLKVAL